jgi:DNA-binding MarR family transcriptional regulator
MPRPPIARLAPLMPQLALALQRGHENVPDELKAAGNLGVRHIGALVSLATQGTGTVGELAERMGMTPAHASLVVGDLVRANLATRTPASEDRRRVVVALSDRARPLLEQMRAQRAAPLRAFLSTLSDDEANVFIDHLHELVAELLSANAPSEGAGTP